jgi:hypothetical protein
MQVIIDEIVNNVRATEKETAISPETMRQIVAACVRAIEAKHAKEQRVKEEQSVDGLWANQPRGDR